MINTFISGYRKSRTEPQFVTGDAVAAQLLCARSPDGSAEDQVIGRLLDPEMITVLRELPDRYRIVVYLADLEGLGYRQISALTGMPLGSVKSRLHRARWTPRTECGRWICPTSGSERAADPTARCSRCSAPRWSARTPRCSPPSTTRNADQCQREGQAGVRRISSKQKAPGNDGSPAIPLVIPGLRSHAPTQRTERPPGAIRSGGDRVPSSAR
jgi:hypothetical protein